MTVITSIPFIVLSALAASACTPKSQRLETETLASRDLEKQMEFSVLRAPNVAGIPPESVPVILFLHGMGSDNRALDEFGVSDSLVRAMATGEIPPAHLVLPSGERGFYLNWHDGTRPYEDYILTEVLPRAEALLGVPKNTTRHIAGVSMGGIGALQIGLRHPDKFDTIACISSVILTREEAEAMMGSPLIRMLVPVKRIWGDGTDEKFSAGIDPFVLAAGLTPDTSPQILLSSGSDEKETIRRTTRRFEQQLRRLGLPHAYVPFQGEHTWNDWIPVIKKAVEEAAFHRRHLSDV